MMIFIIIASVIAVLIVVSIIMFGKHNISVFIRDSQTSEEISGVMHLYSKVKIKEYNIDKNNKPIINLASGLYPVRVESRGYKPKELIINTIKNPVVIHLERKKQTQIPLPIFGMNSWGDITITQGSHTNEFVVNTNGTLPEAAGFFSTGLTILRNRTLVLYISNSTESRFSENRMFKLEYNNGILAHPTDFNLVEGEYIYVHDTPEDTGIEYIIPAEFAGRINFVFYKAYVKNLKITAFFR